MLQEQGYLSTIIIILIELFPCKKILDCPNTSIEQIILK